MTLPILLSGAVGALVATVIGVLLSIWREQIAFRGRVALEVAEWLEDVRATREQYFTARTILESSLSKVKSRDVTLKWEDRFNTAGDRLTVLAQSRASVVKVALAYGEGDMFDLIQELQQHVLELVLEEIKVLESKGLAGLETANISALRHEVDVKQEELLKRLVRGGSLPEVLRKAWDGPSRKTG